jgi:hypothetical protein
MTTLSAHSIYCRRCRFTVSWPAQLEDAGKAELAVLARQDRIAATRRLRDQFDLSLGDAKGVVMHISRDNDVCARCKNVVAKGETACSNCKGANLNW